MQVQLLSEVRLLALAPISCGLIRCLTQAQIQALAATASAPGPVAQALAANPPPSKGMPRVSSANELPMAIQESLSARPIYSGSVPLIAAHQQDLPPLKVLTIRKPPGGGFGFNLSRVNNQHLVRVVTPGGAADLAGARPGDHVIKVNWGVGQNTLVWLVSGWGQDKSLKLMLSSMGLRSTRRTCSTAATPRLWT